jgi:hypothetical protein
MTRPIPLLFALSALTACADADLSAMEVREGAAFDTAGPASNDGAAEERILRVDLTPSGGSGLLAQSVLLPVDVAAPGLEGLTLDLAPTAVFSGAVQAFVASPYDGLSVPGTPDAPLDAVVSATLVGTRTAASALTDAAGAFEMSLPALPDYQIAVLPRDAANVPFFVRSGADLRAGLEEDFALGFGAPVFGRVSQADGTPVGPGVEVWLEDAATGVAGPRVTPASTGHYQLRALPGAYFLVVQGIRSSYIPRQAVGLAVEGADPVEVNVNMGVLTPVEARGVVTDAGGRGLKDVRVRFRSNRFDDTVGVAIVETETDQSGGFRTDLLAGDWTLELIPPYDSSGGPSPLRVTDLRVGDTRADLGSLALPAAARMDGVVRTDEGAPLANARVIVADTTLSGSTWSAITGADGRFSLDAPRVPLAITVSPAQAKHTISHFAVDAPARGLDLTLAPGTPVGGVVRSDGEALPFTLVEVLDGATGEALGTALTDGEGRFSMRVDLGALAPAGDDSAD